MLHTLERALKQLLAAFLRILLGSRHAAGFYPGLHSRILIIRQHNQLGDMLCVVPLLRALRADLPDAHITVMASPVNYDVMANNRYVDDIIKFDKSEFTGRIGWKLYRFPGYALQLRKRGFDIVLVPSTVSTSFTSDLLAYLSGARIRIGAGSIDGKDNPSSFFFTHPRELDWRNTLASHQVQRNMDIWPNPLSRSVDPSLEMTLTKEELIDGKSFIDSVLSGFKRVIIYHPGAGKLLNRWPARAFAAVAAELAAIEDAATIVTSGPMDEEPVNEMRSTLQAPVHLVSNQPIRRVASILRFADLVVSNDTGIMHVAAAVGTPVLSLFGPTDPAQWAPLGSRHRYLLGKGGDIRAIPIRSVVECAREMLRAGQKEERRVKSSE